MKEINFNSDIPLYMQICDYILENIKDHSYEIGDTIPPERELSQLFNVSRVTVRKAIKELVHQGYLYRVQGKGTFVFDKNRININKNKSIGVILDYCNKELEFKILKGIEEVLDQNNYLMTFKSSNNDYKKEAETIQRMKNEGVEGLIILPAEDQKDSTVIMDLKSEQYPFILIDRRLQDCETDCVMSDNKNGTYLATEYLFQLGHERIGFIKSNYNHTSSIEDRITGYMNALNEYNLFFDEKLIFSYDISLGEKNKIEKLYSYLKAEKPTAVLAVNDYHALDLIKMCRKKGIAVPGDLSIIGFDNLELIRHLEIPLTTVAQFPKEIGFHAARLLIDKIKSSDQIYRQIIHQIYYPIELIIGGSCKKLQERKEIEEKVQ